MVPKWKDKLERREISGGGEKRQDTSTVKSFQKILEDTKLRCVNFLKEEGNKILKQISEARSDREKVDLIEKLFSSDIIPEGIPKPVCYGQIVNDALENGWAHLFSIVSYEARDKLIYHLYPGTLSKLISNLCDSPGTLNELIFKLCDPYRRWYPNFVLREPPNIPNELISKLCYYPETLNKLISKLNSDTRNELFFFLCFSSQLHTLNKLIFTLCDYPETLNELISKLHPNIRNKLISQLYPETLNKLISQLYPETLNKLFINLSQNTLNELISNLLNYHPETLRKLISNLSSDTKKKLKEIMSEASQKEA